MGTMKEGMRFFFEVESLQPDHEGEVQCDLCFGWFVYPDGVETMLMPGAFTVCPTCATCPEFAAMSAEKTAADDDRIAKRSNTPTDQQDIRSEYYAIARKIRGLKSFDEIPGGITARHLAAASRSMKECRDAGKAA